MSVDVTPSAQAGVDDDAVTWLSSFYKQHGRPLRVLHVGNIANNAFLNAKFMRKAGVEADVLCYDYYHVMACPEWEEVDIRAPYGDDYSPKFTRQVIGDYRRPDWFIQAPLLLSAEIIEARYTQCNWLRRCAVNFVTALSARRPNGLLTKAAGYLLLKPAHAYGSSVRKAFAYLPDTLVVRAFALLLLKPWRFPEAAVLNVLRYLSGTTAGDREHVFNRMFHYLRERVEARSQPMEERWVAFQDQFRAAFPKRQDQLLEADLDIYDSATKTFQAIFRHYDLVQCYATAPLHAALSGFHPYTAFEHGTLRDFISGDDPLHRLTALGYRLADHTFVTNGDCLVFAQELELPSYGAAIHPIDVDQHRMLTGISSAQMKADYGADLLLFCPLRHDWKVKGTDVHLRALPLIKARFQGRVKLILINWGAEVEASRALLAENGCTDDVIWEPSLARIAMVRLMQAADVVLDQMALPHFGATAPQSIATGTPVISCYEPESTAWLVPEPAPIISAFSPEDVAGAVMQAIDPDWRIDYQRRARDWIDRYHGPSRVIADHLTVYRKVLGYEQ